MPQPRSIASTKWLHFCRRWYTPNPFESQQRYTANRCRVLSCLFLLSVDRTGVCVCVWFTVNRCLGMDATQAVALLVHANGMTLD